MGQIDQTPPAITNPALDVWGQALNTLLNALKSQGNATDAALAVIVETIQDTVAAMFVGNGITFSYDDSTGKIAATVNVGSTLPGIANTAAPSIAGTGVVGTVLTASTGSWSPTPDGFAYQWRRGGMAIPGATGRTYTVVDADMGSGISVAITASKAGYTDSFATSAAITASASASGGTGGGSTTPTPSPTASYLLTDAGDYLTTDAGDRLLAA